MRYSSHWSVMVGFIFSVSLSVTSLSRWSSRFTVLWFFRTSSFQPQQIPVEVERKSNIAPTILIANRIKFHMMTKVWDPFERWPWVSAKHRNRSSCRVGEYVGYYFESLSCYLVYLSEGILYSWLRGLVWTGLFWLRMSLILFPNRMAILRPSAQSWPNMKWSANRLSSSTLVVFTTYTENDQSLLNFLVQTLWSVYSEVMEEEIHDTFFCPLVKGSVNEVI